MSCKETETLCLFLKEHLTKVRLRRFSQFVLRMLAGLTQLVQQSQLRRVAEEQQMLLTKVTMSKTYLTVISN